MSAHREIVELVGRTELYTRSLWIAFSEKLITTGYLQVDCYFKHYSQKERKKLLRELDNPILASLLLKSVSDEQSFLTTLHQISIIDLDRSVIDNISGECGKTIVSWLLYCNKQKYLKEIRLELIGKFLDEHSEYELIDERYIVHRDIECHIIDGIDKYMKAILSLKPTGKMFYRGQTSLNYWIIPSVFREENHRLHEAQLYQELIVRCPSSFEHCKSHLDYLVQMQHYGLPTRLLDITTNPLVALYFAACESDGSKDGEVILFDISEEYLKYERSDTVSILSCLPLFSFAEQQRLLKLSRNIELDDFNQDESVLRLLHEIKTDKPAFVNRINPSDICKNLVVTPSMKNSRIAKQSGAFVVCGLSDDINEASLELFRYRSLKGKKLLLIIQNKQHILNELRTLDVHRATLFPEIDSVASYLKKECIY